jgi:hypothetical protein
MRALTLLSLLALVLGACSSDDEAPNGCLTPVTFHVIGHVQSASGASVAGLSMTVCIYGQYCESGSLFGCDPPNNLHACGQVVVGSDGNFAIDLFTESLGKRDSPRNVRATLAPTTDAGAPTETMGTSTSAGCGQLESSFVLP